MGIADRIILTLYTILMTVASVLTLLCSLGVFSDTGMVAFISHIPGNWVYAVGGVIMLLVSVRLLITGLGLTGVSSLKLSDSDKGKVLVGKGALEDYIAVLSQEIYGIHHVKVIVKLEDQCIDVRINASIEPGINIPETSGEIKSNVRETIKKVTGIDFPVVEEARRAGDPAVLIASSAKIREELGWEPQHSSVDEVISTAWKWHKGHPHGYCG